MFSYTYQSVVFYLIQDSQGRFMTQATAVIAQ